MAIINTDICVLCGACLSECELEAIYKGDQYFLDNDKCNGCGQCSLVCPVGAISFDGHEYYDFLNSQFDTSTFWSESYDKWTGVPYLSGGYTTNGIECSFLTYMIYFECGCYYDYLSTSAFFSLGHPDFYEVLSPQEGDIVIWENHHMVIYINHPDYPEQHLYSVTSSQGVRITGYDYWVQHFGSPRFFRIYKP